MSEKFLPIGTVVLLKNATKRLMITGYCSLVDANSTKIYDYVGSKFPEGIFGGEDVALFDHDQIAVVSHMGLVDDEYKEFNTNLINVVNKELSNGVVQTPVSNEPVYNNGIPNDLNKMIQSISIEDIKSQMVVEPTEFDDEKLKIPSFAMDANKKEEKKEEKVSVESKSRGSDSEPTLGDGKPVLQLQPIFNDEKSDVGASSTTSSGIFERL